MRAVERRQRVRAAVTLLLVSGAVVGCGGGDGVSVPGPDRTTVDDASRAPTSAPSSQRPTAAAEPRATSGPTTGAPSGATPDGTVVVTGTVTEGVETGCLLLVSGGTTYLLLGGQDELRAGARLAVEGVVARDLATTCQQGVPLEVHEVTPQ